MNLARLTPQPNRPRRRPRPRSRNRKREIEDEGRERGRGRKFAQAAKTFMHRRLLQNCDVVYSSPCEERVGRGPRRGETPLKTRLLSPSLSSIQWRRGRNTPTPLSVSRVL